MSRFLAWAYSVVVTLAAIFAWVVDISMQNDPREHLLPDFVLLFVTFPLSLSEEFLYPLAPAFFALPFLQLSFATLCGAAQTALLWWIAARLRKKNAG
jgi:hypothetical protein